MYVAQNSNSKLPLIYLISGVWGWARRFIIAVVAGARDLWTGAVAVFTPNVPRVMRARVLAVLGLVSMWFPAVHYCHFESFRSTVARRRWKVRDLNPLLQDIGLAIHPPMLYIGYVGFAVAFAFSIAALISGQVDSAWARWARPWTNIAWLFLTLGIALR